MTASNKVILNVFILGLLTPTFGWIYYDHFYSKKSFDSEISLENKKIETRKVELKKELTSIDEKIKKNLKQNSELLEKKESIIELLSRLQQREISSKAISKDTFLKNLTRESQTFLKSINEETHKQFLSLSTSDSKTIISFDANTLVQFKNGRMMVPKKISTVIEEVIAIVTEQGTLPKIEIFLNSEHNDKLPRLETYLKDLFKPMKPFYIVNRNDNIKDFSMKFILDEKAISQNDSKN